MNWYLILTKPRQENCALQNLERQGYVCYLPVFSAGKLRQRVVTVVNEPLFPRYLFIKLESGAKAKSWSPISSTKGVSRLVSFGSEPAKVDEQLINALMARERAQQGWSQSIYFSGERVMVTAGAFSGIEGIYQMTDGSSRVMVLIELLNKPTQLLISQSALRKVG